MADRSSGYTRYFCSPCGAFFGQQVHGSVVHRHTEQNAGPTSEINRLVLKLITVLSGVPPIWRVSDAHAQKAHVDLFPEAQNQHGDEKQQ